MQRIVNSNEIYVDSFDNFWGHHTLRTRVDFTFSIRQAAATILELVGSKWCLKTQTTRAANTDTAHILACILDFFMDLVYLFDFDTIGARVCVCPRL